MFVIFYLNVYNVYVVLKYVFLLLFQIRKKRKVKPINHEVKILNLWRPNDNQEWFWVRLGRAGYMIWFTRLHHCTSCFVDDFIREVECRES